MSTQRGLASGSARDQGGRACPSSAASPTSSPQPPPGGHGRRYCQPLHHPPNPRRYFADKAQDRAEEIGLDTDAEKDAEGDASASSDAAAGAEKKED